MHTIDSDTIFVVAANIRHRRIFDEGVVLRQADGEVLVVNDSAVEILDRIDGKTSVQQMLNSMMDVYDTDADGLQQDVSLYLQELLELGVIENTGEHAV